MIDLVNIPNVFIIRGGSGTGTNLLANRLGDSYNSWGYFNQNTREDLEKLECVIISSESIYCGLFGSPVDLWNLDQFHNSEIYYSELVEEIEICLRCKNLITLIIEGLVCYKYLEKINKLLEKKASVLNVEIVGKNIYSSKICMDMDKPKLSTHKLYPYSGAVNLLKQILIGRERPEMYKNTLQYFPEFLYQEKYVSNSPEKFNNLHLPNVENLRVLDIGCDTGYFVFRYKQLGGFAEGIDLSKNAINIASKFRNVMYALSGITFYQGNIYEFFEKKYDLISLISTYLFLKEKENIFHKVFTLLNDGGVFVLESGLFENNFYFPNETLFEELIKNMFEIIYINKFSLPEEGDRVVYHLKKI